MSRSWRTGSSGSPAAPLSTSPRLVLGASGRSPSSPARPHRPAPHYPPQPRLASRTLPPPRYLRCRRGGQRVVQQLHLYLLRRAGRRFRHVALDHWRGERAAGGRAPQRGRAVPSRAGAAGRPSTPGHAGGGGGWADAGGGAALPAAGGERAAQRSARGRGTAAAGRGGRAGGGAWGRGKVTASISLPATTGRRARGGAFPPGASGRGWQRAARPRRKGERESWCCGCGGVARPCIFLPLVRAAGGWVGRCVRAGAEGGRGSLLSVSYFVNGSSPRSDNSVACGVSIPGRRLGRSSGREGEPLPLSQPSPPSQVRPGEGGKAGSTPPSALRCCLSLTLWHGVSECVFRLLLGYGCYMGYGWS